MAGMSAGYDLSVATFSPDGRVFQVLYAGKAVDNASTSVALVCSDGVVFGIEKCQIHKMLVPLSHRRIFAVDEHVGIAVAGLIPDARQVISQARSEAINFRKNFGEVIPVRLLAERIALYVHSFTLYWSVRPFGASFLVGGIENDGSTMNGEMYCIEPSGTCYKYFGMAIGKGKQLAKAELEKLDFSSLTCEKALFHVCKILYRAHEEFKDKEMEIELAVISHETDCKFKIVDQVVQKAVEKEVTDHLEQLELDS